MGGLRDAYSGVLIPPSLASLIRCSESIQASKKFSEPVQKTEEVKSDSDWTHRAPQACKRESRRRRDKAAGLSLSIRMRWATTDSYWQGAIMSKGRKIFVSYIRQGQNNKVQEQEERNFSYCMI